MSDHDDWLEWRARGLGASDIPALLRLSNFQSPWSLWASKVGLLPATEQTQRQRIGHVLEAAIAQLFHEETGLHVGGEQTWCTSAKHSWARATVDGFVVEAFEKEDGGYYGDPIGVLEIKTDGGRPTEELPPRVLAQVQWQLYVTDLPRAWVATLYSGFQFRVHDVRRDEQDIAFMVERAERFWVDHVLTGEPPEVDGSDATTDAIAAVWPHHETGKAVDIPADLLLRRADLKEAVKAYKAELDEVENVIRALLEDAETGLVGGQPALTYRTQTRSGIDSKALQRDFPDAYEACRTSTTHRVLRAVRSKA